MIHWEMIEEEEEEERDEDSLLLNVIQRIFVCLESKKR